MLLFLVINHPSIHPQQKQRMALISEIKLDIINDDVNVDFKIVGRSLLHLTSCNM
jgi:hypothetical protein